MPNYFEGFRTEQVENRIHFRASYQPRLSSHYYPLKNGAEVVILPVCLDPSLVHKSNTCRLAISRTEMNLSPVR